MVRDDERKGWFKDDHVIPGSGRIGHPGTVSGLCVGEGGPTQDDVVSFVYDDSAVSESRFASIDINSPNTLPSDAGDRVYFGAPRIFWAIEIALGVAASNDGVYILRYWDGSSLRQSTVMVIEGEQINRATDFFSTDPSRSMIATWDRDVIDEWIAGDDETDLLPSTGSDLFWIAVEVASSPLIAPRLDKIETRGSDFDIAGIDFARPIFWGRCRHESELTANTSALDAAATDAAKISNVNITGTLTAALHQFKNNKTESVSLRWKIPDQTDTSCKVQIFIDISALSAGGVDWELDFLILEDGAPLGPGESSTGIITATIPVGSSGVVLLNRNLTAVTKIDISFVDPGSIMEVTLRRMGMADANPGSVFLHAVRIVSITWQLGKPA